jgi:hypothetical protein
MKDNVDILFMNDESMIVLSALDIKGRRVTVLFDPIFKLIM